MPAQGPTASRSQSGVKTRAVWLQNPCAQLLLKLPPYVTALGASDWKEQCSLEHTCQLPLVGASGRQLWTSFSSKLQIPTHGDSCGFA